jgi:hypothetical protein
MAGIAVPTGPGTSNLSLTPSASGASQPTPYYQTGGDSAPPVAATFSTTPPVTTSTPSTTTSAADAAAAAKQAQINSAISYGTSNAIAAGTAGTAEAAGNLGETGENYNTQIQTGQNNIDLARTQLGTAQINSIKQLQNTIKDGLQGTGVQLGNTGALSSSAADAAARAYAQYGDVQTNVANNTAATGNEAQDVQQNNLDITSEGYQKSLDEARDAAIANIQGTAISALNNLGILVSVYLGGNPAQINAPAIQQQIIQSAQNDLAQVDSNYQNMLQGIHPATADQTAASAEAASNAGVVPASGAPYSPVPLASASSNTSGGPAAAPPPSLIPLTLGSPKDQTPGS